MDDGPADYYLYKSGKHDQFKRDFTFYSGHFRRAVLKGDSATLALVGHGMALITPTERAALHRKWMGYPVNFTPYARMFAIALAIVVLMVVLILLWVRALRRAVKLHTRSLEERNTQLNALIDSSPDLVWLKDTKGTYLACNSLVASFFGHAVEDIVGHTDHDLREATAADETLQRDLETMQKRRQCRFDITITHPVSGQLHILESIKAPVCNPAGHVTGTITVARDVTNHKLAEERLTQAAKVFESIQDGVIVTDSERRIVNVNPAFVLITGYAAEDVLGESPIMLDSKRNGQDEFARLWTAESDPDTWRGEVWNRRKSGRLFPAWWSIDAARNSAGKITHYVAVFTDTGRVKEYQNRIRFLTHYDPLTRLPNRALLADRLERAITRAATERRSAAVMLLGLDNLSSVNESFGHAMGDAFIAAVGARIQKTLDSRYTVACVRSSKFAILIEEDTDAVGLIGLADHLNQVLAKPLEIGDHRISLRSCIGIAVYPSDGNDAETLLKNVDTAMHRSRSSVDRKVSFYSAAWSAAARQALELDHELRLALEEEQFELLYQPQWSAESGHLCGIEALLRWRSPSRGLVRPDLFIPHAEGSGLIVPIGRWAVRTACAQLVQWRSQGLPDVPIAVNVSAQQLRSSSFVEDVAMALQASGLPGDRLELEITEGELLDKSPETDRVMGEIWALGVSFAIDDFGTGYSSLAYLRHLPANALKIDRSFIEDVPRDADATRIVAAIVSMAHTLNMRVVAEGVETQHQADALRAMSCDHLQGYFRGTPMRAKDFFDFVDTAAQG